MRDVSEPDLEVVQIRSGESFKMWSHGYPYHTVRWHFHPEYEIHLITETSGCYFVGDFIGDFQPGNFVMRLAASWSSPARISGGQCPAPFVRPSQMRASTRP